MSNSFRHLLSSTFASKKTAKEVDENEEDKKAAYPENDKEDGKKGKKASKKAKDCDDEKMSEGDKEEEKEEKDDKEGEEEEDRDDKEEKEEDDENEKNDHKRSKKGKKASADMNRARAIMASPYAAGQPDLAASLAFDSDMSVAEAENRMMMTQMQKTIEANGKNRRVSIDERMAKVINPNVGMDAMPDSMQGSAMANVSLEQMEKLSPEARALQIVNAGRLAAGEPLLRNLPNPNRLVG